jgi:hypothetical protein
VQVEIDFNEVTSAKWIFDLDIEKMGVEVLFPS